jgi:hypothetical protein
MWWSIIVLKAHVKTYGGHCLPIIHRNVFRENKVILTTNMCQYNVRAVRCSCIKFQLLGCGKTVIDGVTELHVSFQLSNLFRHECCWSSWRIIFSMNRTFAVNIVHSADCCKIHHWQCISCRCQTECDRDSTASLVRCAGVYEIPVQTAGCLVLMVGCLHQRRGSVPPFIHCVKNVDTHCSIALCEMFPSQGRQSTERNI